MAYKTRIGAENLTSSYKDGEVLQHTDLNELESVIKTAINANYEDIQKIQDGSVSIASASNLEGAVLSRSTDGIIESSDDKIPSSKQVKDYVDNTNSALTSTVREIVVDEVDARTLITVTGGTATNPVLFSDLETGSYLVKSGCIFRWAGNFPKDDYNVNSGDSILLVKYYDLGDDEVAKSMTLIAADGLTKCWYSINHDSATFSDYLTNDMLIIPGYKGNGSGVTQVLKNINGTPTWVDE